jgi:protein-S-isoprenylcysteine O-methyltransferase Ste14
MVPALGGVLSLGEFTADLRLAARQKVEKTGVYRWVRHPLYAALIFCCAGSLLFFKSFLFLILFALIPAVYVEAKREEKLLVEAFGEEYERYQDVVGMFFPKFPRRSV